VRVATVSAAASGGVRVEGVAHWPDSAPAGGLALAHGAGSDCHAPWLVALADAFADRGVAVLRCNLPFRQLRPTGPPRPADAGQDREGLRAAARWLREAGIAGVWLGGHSYGGRQASLLAAADPAGLRGLLLSSYPLHPPGKPGQLRTGHLPSLRIPVLAVQGSRDTFGGAAEVEEAFQAIPAEWRVMKVPGAGHDLKIRAGYPALAAAAFSAFTEFFFGGR
jgi:predicted alpha/beta-hydrolase family hydrolase